jgi:hypothetical protein
MNMNNLGLIKKVQKKLGISLTWDPSYSRLMHAYKDKLYKCNVIRTEICSKTTWLR